MLFQRSSLKIKEYRPVNIKKESTLLILSLIKRIEFKLKDIISIEKPQNKH